MDSQRLDRAYHLTRIGEPALTLFREDELSVDLDLEDAVFALDEACVCSELAAELGRQPGGTWLVVSNDAILDRDVHCGSFRDNAGVTSTVPRRWNPVFSSCVR
jgi:hypothetical protein